MIYSTWMVTAGYTMRPRICNNLLPYTGSGKQCVSDFNLLLPLYVEGGKAHMGYGVSYFSCYCGKIVCQKQFKEGLFWLVV